MADDELSMPGAAYGRSQIRLAEYLPFGEGIFGLLMKPGHKALADAQAHSVALNLRPLPLVPLLPQLYRLLAVVALCLSLPSDSRQRYKGP